MAFAKEEAVAVLDVKWQRCIDDKTVSKCADLTFPVHRILRSLKEGGYSKSIGKGAPIYLAAVLQLLTAEILQISGVMANYSPTRRIKPRHVSLAIESDSDLKQLLKDIIIAEGGVSPHINRKQIPRRSKCCETCASTGRKSPEY